MDKQSPHLLLRVPTPTQQSLSFCEASPRDLKRWIAGLPKANIGETARQLYLALVELNRLQATTDSRLQLLELLRPEVYFVCQHLERHFLNQAIVLDERPRKVANLCQALQNHLALGYKMIIARLAAQPARDLAPTLALALQRATHSLSAALTRTSQLYCPVPEGLWLELHQLYQIARARDLQGLPIRDPLAPQTRAQSVEHGYLAALLLGCARCNQMRQSGIARLAEALQSWSALASLRGDAASCLFAVAPEFDGPPRYSVLFAPGELPGALGIDPTALVDAIKEYLLLAEAERGAARLQVPEGCSLDLLQHLSAAWGDISERTFQRTPGKGSLTLCIGMSAVHFHLAKQRPFDAVLRRPGSAGSAVFKAGRGAPDVWSAAFDAQQPNSWTQSLPFEEIEYSRPSSPTGQGGAQSAGETPDSYPTYPLPIVNHSPGGYCLAWPKEVPGQLQAGELLGVQDTPGQGWSVAVVRWIRQVRGGGTQMGIELIAPHAQACGLQLVRKASEQNSQYLRALLLPEIAAISRPATLITPRMPFQEGHKVMINLNGVERRAVLARRQCSTGSFGQFEYRGIDGGGETETSATGAQSRGAEGEEDFDSLWKSL